MTDFTICDPPAREHGEEQQAYLLRVVVWSDLAAAAKKLAPVQVTALKRAIRDGFLVTEGETFRGGGVVHAIRAAASKVWASFVWLAVRMGLGRALQEVSIGRSCGGPGNAIDLRDTRLPSVYLMYCHAFNLPFVIVLFVDGEGEVSMSLETCTWGLNEVAIERLFNILKPFHEIPDFGDAWNVSTFWVLAARLPLPVARTLASRMYEVAIDCKPPAVPSGQGCDGADGPADLDQTINDIIEGEQAFPLCESTTSEAGHSDVKAQGGSLRIHTMRMDAEHRAAMERAKQLGFLVSPDPILPEGFLCRSQKPACHQLMFAYFLCCLSRGRSKISIARYKEYFNIYIIPASGKSFEPGERGGMWALFQPFIGESDRHLVQITEKNAFLSGVTFPVAEMVASRLFDLTVG